nr:hypothetical protein [Tanacetum cinerariifolium]
MSNINNNMQTQTSNSLHNAIMEAGSKDRPSMLAPGNYIQWKSRIKRYIDTKPNRELIHYYLENPLYELGWNNKPVLDYEGNPTSATARVFETYNNVEQEIRNQLNAEAEAVQIILTGIDNDIYSTVDACPNACEMWKAIERLKQGNPTTATQKVFETYKNVTQEIRDQLNAEAEAVQIILTGIDNDIYSTVDACPNACEMWKAIERLKQDESINVQDLETNLFWKFGKFTSLDGESLESYYSRFYKMINELTRNQCKVTNHQVNVQFLLQLQPEWQRFVTLVKQSQELKHVSYHKLYDILKQHQHEVNEIRAEKIARVANPLALVAQQQQVYHPQTYPTHFNQNSSSRTQQTTTRNRGKAVVNFPQPIYDQEPSMNYKNFSQDKRDPLNAKAEAVQIILTWIDNDIYSTVDACPNACEMWKAIERLKQGESINVQDLEINFYWEFRKFTSRDGESLKSYYSRFYKMV